MNDTEFIEIAKMSTDKAVERLAEHLDRLEGVGKNATPKDIETLRKISNLVFMRLSQLNSGGLH